MDIRQGDNLPPLGEGGKDKNKGIKRSMRGVGEQLTDLINQMVNKANISFPALLSLALLVGCSGSNQQVTDADASSVNKDSVRFRKHVLTKDFISEGVAVGDVDHDGDMDVMPEAISSVSPSNQRTRDPFCHHRLRQQTPVIHCPPERSRG